MLSPSLLPPSSLPLPSFLAGPAYSMADVVMTAILFRLGTVGQTKEYLQPRPKVRRGRRVTGGHLLKLPPSLCKEVILCFSPEMCLHLSPLPLKAGQGGEGGAPSSPLPLKAGHVVRFP